MIVTTGNEVAGHTISQYLGVVRGIVVRSPSIALPECTMRSTRAEGTFDCRKERAW